MAHLDRKRLVGEMAARYGIRLDDTDPTLAIISLNQLVLEETIGEVCEQLRARIAEFEASADKLENRSGHVLAQQAKESAAEIRRQLQGDIHVAGLRSRELVQQIHKAHTRPVLIRWTALGILIGFILFVCGIWVGRMTVLSWSRAGFLGRHDPVLVFVLRDFWTKVHRWALLLFALGIALFFFCFVHEAFDSPRPMHSVRAAYGSQPIRAALPPAGTSQPRKR